jgi:hypothetical protein
MGLGNSPLAAPGSIWTLAIPSQSCMQHLLLSRWQAHTEELSLLPSGRRSILSRGRGRGLVVSSIPKIVRWYPGFSCEKHRKSSIEVSTHRLRS